MFSNDCSTTCIEPAPNEASRNYPLFEVAAKTYRHVLRVHLKAIGEVTLSWL